MPRPLNVAWVHHPTPPDRPSIEQGVQRMGWQWSEMHRVFEVTHTRRPDVGPGSKMLGDYCHKHGCYEIEQRWSFQVHGWLAAMRHCALFCWVPVRRVEVDHVYPHRPRGRYGGVYRGD